MLLLSLLVAGCANNVEPGAAPAAPASSDVVDLQPSPGKPSATLPAEDGAATITGTVSAGVEPSCLLLQDAKGSHLLIFDDAAMRAEAAVGTKVTLVGRSDPSMMSTCQQGVPFIVTAVRPS
ncbi:MAG: hypothetical protein ABW046_03750 [Actinoplanes sp.]